MSGIVVSNVQEPVSNTVQYIPERKGRLQALGEDADVEPRCTNQENKVAAMFEAGPLTIRPL